MSSRWDEVHVRHDVRHHALRLHEATEFELTDLEDEPAELEQLRWARWISTEATQLVEAAVIDARRAGASWTTVGAILELTKQGAWDRYRKLDEDLDDSQPDIEPEPAPPEPPKPPRAAVHNPPKRSRRKRR